MGAPAGSEAGHAGVSVGEWGLAGSGHWKHVWGGRLKGGEGGLGPRGPCEDSPAHACPPGGRPPLGVCLFHSVLFFCQFVQHVFLAHFLSRTFRHTRWGPAPCSGSAEEKSRGPCLCLDVGGTAAPVVPHGWGGVGVPGGQDAPLSRWEGSAPDPSSEKGLELSAGRNSDPVEA